MHKKLWKFLQNISAINLWNYATFAMHFLHLEQVYLQPDCRKA
uniref:Uncharacterized protein n=1 Tax=Rhizophora mucronata TaxID=61149 RepID=A0A2P2QPF8_RHIMU